MIVKALQESRSVRAAFLNRQPAARQMAMKSAAFSDGTADQAAVDVGLREQRGGVVGLDAAAVEDAHAVAVAGGRLQLRAQHRVHGLRLLGRGGAAGADGPHGLVGDDDLAGAMRQRGGSPRRAAA
jgi:hypothetical protein